MTRPRNVVILTSGLTGSSVLASMFEQAGYWTGDTTIQKKDYDTKENSELVALNKLILSSVGYSEDRKRVFRSEDVDLVFDRAQTLDRKPFEDFVAKCNRNRPWVWKDPRLTLTIQWWGQFLDLSEVVFPIIYRDAIQGWVSSVLRYNLRSLRESRRYRESIRKHLVGFVESENAEFLEILYEDLIQHPDQTIERINRMALSNLSRTDFDNIFRGKPGQRQHGARDLIRATLIYLSNYKSTR